MRKKLLSALIASSIICSFFTPFAFAQDATVNASYVNMRSGPGLDYKVINCLAKGTSINVTSTDNADWYAVSYNGQTGYMSSQYIQVSSGSSFSQPTGLMTADEFDAYVASQASSPSPTPTVEVSESTSVASPSPSVSPTASVETTPEPTPTPTPEPNPAATQTPEASAAPSSDTSTSVADSIGSISGDYVRFRTGPGTTYTIITMYNRGQEVSILGYEGDWVKCTINGKEGYVSKTYVKTTSDEVSSTSSSNAIESITSPGSSLNSGNSDSLTTDSTSMDTGNTASKTGYISGNNVRFRAAASTSSDIIKEFYFGNTVEITGTDGDWTAVSSDGKSGFVYSQYVKEGTYSAVAESSSDSGSSTTSSNVSGDEVVTYAMQYLGTNYKWGGQDPSTGFDCSGFVYYVYGHFGISLNRTAQDQALNGTTISAADLQPGDILCFYTSGSTIGHSGIYIGDDKFIHSANSNTGVIITQLSGYYANRGFVAKRVI